MVEMIEIPKIEYERMIAALEDAEDNAAVERHLRNPEVGMPAELVARMIANQTTEDDHLVLEEFSPYRKFESEEVLK